jgi:BlaI family transcriptional regulator, penicillinase repressor
MAKPARPTDAELEILTVLWSRGPSTVREVHDTITRRRPARYTTVLKLLQIMDEKGWSGATRNSARISMPPLSRAK